MCAHLAFMTVAWTKELIWERKNHLWVSRYKHAYTIFRKGDERTRLYPKPWITDTQYLDPDHPMLLTDIPRYRLPPIEVHRYDPHMSGPDENYDGKPPHQKPLDIDWKRIPGLKAERDKWKQEWVNRGNNKSTEEKKE